MEITIFNGQNPIEPPFSYGFPMSSYGLNILIAPGSHRPLLSHGAMESEWLWPFLSVVCLKIRRYSTTSSCCKYLSSMTHTGGLINIGIPLLGYELIPSTYILIYIYMYMYTYIFGSTIPQLLISQQRF